MLPTPNQELKSVLRETLSSRGVMSAVRARLRAEIYHAIEDENPPEPPPKPSVAVVELIRDFLIFHRYYNTLSVLLSETGLEDREVNDKSSLAKTFGLRLENHELFSVRTVALAKRVHAGRATSTHESPTPLSPELCANRLFLQREATTKRFHLRERRVYDAKSLYVQASFVPTHGIAISLKSEPLDADVLDATAELKPSSLFEEN